MPLADNDTVTTIGDGGRRVWLYPLRVWGRHVTARTVFGWALFVVLLIGPWIEVGGHPAMRFDIPERRFYLWGLTLFATDANYLLFLFGTFIFSVFFFTALLGRVWCGWACPQTVFLEGIIRPIEQLIEGPPSQRKALDRAPWTASKLGKKALKLTAFLVVAGAIATTVVAYFIGADGVLEAQADPFSHPVATAFFVAVTGLLMFDFAWFREQTCVVACPYGRFQSVLMDPDSLTIAYDVRRGEPRGKPGKAGVGDCVDCHKCVAVCPTGIDIRKGVQMECINCMACIDACDSVMDKLGRPRGLVRFTSEKALATGEVQLVRPRVVAYGAVLIAIAIGLVTALSLREPVELAITRPPGEPFVVRPDGRLQNMVRLRISNKLDDAHTWHVAAADPGEGEVITPVSALRVEGNSVQAFPVLLVRPDPGAQATPFRLRVTGEGGFSQTVEAVFLAPPPAPAEG
ncbi:MAG: cytochrome c oxidase accessory protein CcoG [bacterium]